MTKTIAISKDRKDIHQIYGINGTTAVLKSDKYEIQSIEILEKSSIVKDAELSVLLSRYSAQTCIIPHSIFHKKYDGKRTQGIAITFIGEATTALPSFNTVEGNYCLLMIDNLTDPQNLGQIVRTSECAGINGIIIPGRNSVGMTDAVLQVSQGAFCHIPIYVVTNLHQTLNQLKEDDFWSIAIENGIDAKPWDRVDYKGKILLVVGSEGQGIKPLVLKSCDFQATIPMQGDISSLNVSAAVSAIVFERLRQIKKSTPGRN